MLRFSAVVLPCVLLLAPVAVAADGDRARPVDQFHVYCEPPKNAFDQPVCVYTNLAPRPCEGTVEQRLSCLETKLARQNLEIGRLRSELNDLKSPRVRPLQEPHLSLR